MAHTTRTLSLDPKKWDLTLNSAGRINTTVNAAATAQNVANEARLFTEDAYFNQDRGIPYFVAALGQRVNLAVLRSYLRRAALSVPDVEEVLAVQIISVDQATRAVKGDIQFTIQEGTNNAAIRADF